VPENYGCITKTNDNWAGQIAGVIFFNTAPASESETVLDVVLTSQPSARWLEETKTPSNGTIAEVALVRMTLAWITGIVLIIATLLGVRLSNNKNRSPFFPPLINLGKLQMELINISNVLLLPIPYPFFSLSIFFCKQKKKLDCLLVK
jgi:hypothetical protein